MRKRDKLKVYSLKFALEFILVAFVIGVLKYASAFFGIDFHESLIVIMFIMILLKDFNIEVEAEFKKTKEG